MLVKEGNQLRRFRWFDWDDVIMKKIRKIIRRNAAASSLKNFPHKVETVKTKYTRKQKHKG